MHVCQTPTTDTTNVVVMTMAPNVVVMTMEAVPVECPPGSAAGERAVHAEEAAGAMLKRPLAIIT